MSHSRAGCCLSPTINSVHHIVRWTNSTASPCSGTITYLYNDLCDIFWEPMPSMDTLPRKGRQLTREQHSQRVVSHNERLHKDWSDFVCERLSDLQIRLECDMLNAAYLEYVTDAHSSMQRGSTSSNMLVSKWATASQSTVGLLQDCIIFRDEPIAQVAQSGMLPWLPPPGSITSLLDLVDAPLIEEEVDAGTCTRSRTQLVPWVSKLMISAPLELTLIASIYLHKHLLRAGQRIKSLELGRKPHMQTGPANLVSSVGKAVDLHSDVQLASAVLQSMASVSKKMHTLKSLLESRKAPDPMQSLDTGSLDNKSRFLQDCRSFKVPVVLSALDLQLNSPYNVACAVRKVLDSTTYSTSEGNKPLATVLLQVAFHQLQGQDRKPIFKQPIPWNFIPQLTKSIFQYCVEVEDGSKDVQMLIHDQVLRWIDPVYAPCILTPCRWTSPQSGGYHLASGGNVDFRVSVTRTAKGMAVTRKGHQHDDDVSVRSKAPGVDPLSRLDRGEVPDNNFDMESACVGGLDGPYESAPYEVGETPEALNFLGHRPWRINSPILRVVEAVWETQEGVAAVPCIDPPQAPRSTPSHFQLASQVHSTWHSATNTYRSVIVSLAAAFQPPSERQKRVEQHAGRLSKRAEADYYGLRSMFGLQLKVAKEYEHYPRMFFPHNMDFRGRAYPLPPHLNHMGNDLCRGLLTFADARPLGEHGFKWLLIHLANLYGTVDKDSFDVRVRWSLEQLPLVLDSASKPLSGKRWWLDAEKPWSVLATCKEIAAAVASGDVTTFLSHLPVHQDGSCNGLQHYAALGRDQEGGVAVNLIDHKTPRDVYTRVADVVRTAVAADAITTASEADMGKNGALSRRDIAHRVLPEVDRKLVKQSVMTTVYGVTRLGAKDQILNRLVERGWARRSPESQRAAMYIAGKTSAALEGVFHHATEIMKWLRDSGRKVAKVGRKVRWSTPLGLTIQQPYLDTKGAVNSALGVSIVEESLLKPHLAKQASAFPPNYIHSLDATHLMLTAEACKKAGIAFAGVHDSYWTHAADVDLCRTLLREEFVKLYSQPLLKNLQADLQKEVDQSEYRGNKAVRISEPPEQGKLELQEVLTAEYFFN